MLKLLYDSPATRTVTSIDDLNFKYILMHVTVTLMSVRQNYTLLTRAAAVGTCLLRVLPNSRHSSLISDKGTVKVSKLKGKGKGKNLPLPVP
jgi:hypothetical protein